MRVCTSPLAFRSLVLLAALAGGPAMPSATVAQVTPGSTGLRLGEVSCPNSGATDAQESFERALLLLHSFEYGAAADAFREAQRIDPVFAMAYWGEAMTYNHPVWMEQDREAALEALSRFASTPEERATRAGPDGGGTAREAAYMRAVDVLYGPGEKEARDFAYADAMAALHQTFPNDEDAAAFHALALLGTAHEGRDFATYMQSAAILEQVVDAHPNHPGIAHYLIHSYDDPIHAPLGIRAAHAYSEIAPDAAHAQHMTSHIFVALGMWDDVVEANENSMRVVDAERAARGQPPGACGHYNYWLEYGYLQQGRDADALRLLRECYDRVLEAPGGRAPEPADSPVDSYARMLSRYVVDAGDPGAEAFDEPLDWPLDLSRAPHARATGQFASGYAAAKRGDIAGLRAALEVFASTREAIEDDGAQGSPGDTGRRRLEVLELELEAMLRSLERDLDRAIELARSAAAAEAEMPFEFGPPFSDKPTHELLGELLLAAGRPAEARAAFETAVSRTPRRVQATSGLATAEQEMLAE